MRHIIPISGKDSLTTALVQTAYEPDLPYEYFVNVVGRELPPFYDWLVAIEKELGQQIVRVESSLPEIIEGKGILPSPKVRFCTREAKIRPMEAWIGDDEATVYYGLRADEAERIGYQDGKHITSRYPLRERGVDILGVWTILEAKGLLPPPLLFPEVIEGVREKMGADFSVADSLRPWHYNLLFSGRVRQFNCWDCFYMRRYEFAYLYLHWPEQFKETVKMEESTGADGFSIVPGIPMRSFADRAYQYVDKRISQVTTILYRLFQLRLFEESIDDLNLTSCGMFCGK